MLPAGKMRRSSTRLTCGLRKQGSRQPRVFIIRDVRATGLQPLILARRVAKSFNSLGRRVAFPGRPHPFHRKGVDSCSVTLWRRCHRRSCTSRWDSEQVRLCQKPVVEQAELTGLAFIAWCCLAVVMILILFHTSRVLVCCRSFYCVVILCLL